MIVVVVYICRLFSIQVIDQTYRESARTNALYNKTLFPLRGIIYDRNNNIVVGNQPYYDVTVVMRNLEEDLDTLELCRHLDITKEYFETRIKDIKNSKKNPGYSPYTEQVFMSQLSIEEISTFRENLYRFKGFGIENRTQRQYHYNVGAHLLGDLGEVSKSEMDKDDFYDRGDYIGKQGVEKYYENYLRGEKGVAVMLKDAYGRIQGSYMNGEYDVAPVAGKNLTLSVDIALQQLGERLMLGKIGSIVAIEPSTGEILCMVSAPTFSPTELVGRHRSENYQQLSNHKSKPLLNRTIMGTYPPGSTFKTAQALTFLEEGIVDSRTSYPCSNGFVYGRLKVGCHAHSSPISLAPAIATSCNSYFCWGYFRMIGDEKYGSVQQAMTVWKDYMVDMGFGYTLGVDLPGEKRGMIPNAQYYDKLYNKSWNGLTIISNSIGQGEVTLTPLQIANLGATIANRGYYITPHVVKQIEGAEIDSIYTAKHFVNISRENYELVVEGMRQAVIEGTCTSAASENYIVCGKTGTAQNNGKDHSVFMGFAPMDNPQIAIAVYVENGGFGATYGVPIGALMMEQYLTGTLSEESEKKVEYFANRVIDYGEQTR
jgi:penicillin-binding protein 2